MKCVTEKRKISNENSEDIVRFVHFDGIMNRVRFVLKDIVGLSNIYLETIFVSLLVVETWIN